MFVIFLLSSLLFVTSLVFLVVSIFSSSVKSERPKLFLLLGISLIACTVSLITPTDDDNTDNNDTDIATNISETTTNLLSNDTTEITYTESDLSDIENCVKINLGENEFLENIILENNDLHIYIDLSKSDPAPLTFEDLAISRTSTITDAILANKEYDNSWNTITIDYGEIGYITNSKENIMDNGYGRYFPSAEFVLNNSKTSNYDSSKEPNHTSNVQKEFPANVESVCRALTKRFVENVVLEEYSMLAFNVEDFELDENGNGTIKILYMPSDLTKVNLSIIKNGNVYTIESALLSGLYEVDMNMVAEENKVFIES